MRIALAVDGTRGDVHPMLVLGEHLRGLGHAVVVCGPPDAEPDCRARGFELRPMGVSVRQFMDQEASGIARGRLAFARAGHRYFEATIARQFERLPAATSDVDAIFGAGLCFAGGSAAELHGIPYRLIAYCPILLPSAEHAPFIVPGANTPPWLNRLLWRFVVPVFSRLVGIRINQHRRRLGLPLRGDFYRSLLSERPILSANPLLAPLPADCDVPVTSIPYLHPPPGEPLPEKLLSFLESGAPPVYIGFGSMTDPDPERTTKTILDAVESAGCRAVISAGWAGLGEGPLPETVFRTGPADHARLFPRTAAVVHHGGAGTTTTSARAGVPQIVVPHGVDQYYWGARVQALGVAPPPLARHRLTAEGLAGSLRAVLDNELLGERASELGARIREADVALPDVPELLG
jgi:UDP:flavonoid glycosyltransferase YjiC (YdhE family)